MTVCDNTRHDHDNKANACLITRSGPEHRQLAMLRAGTLTHLRLDVGCPGRNINDMVVVVVVLSRQERRPVTGKCKFEFKFGRAFRFQA